jgi:DNA modification methylase
MNLDLFVEEQLIISEKLYQNKTKIIIIEGEFWTSKQRKANSIHEISYRACFKPQLPYFFISNFTQKGNVVYDPFSGRGTTIIEAALNNRRIVANDINPLSKILTQPRIEIPRYSEINERIETIPYYKNLKSDIDLSMFYQEETLSEILSLKNYLINRYESNKEDHIDRWIRMVATNRLTGHSTNFFSVYTLPPNQAISPQKQKQLNENFNRYPVYKNTKNIILIKTQSLLRDIDNIKRRTLHSVAKEAVFLTEDARSTPQIADNSISLIVTSPPFLDVIDYASDNWLRCWFNNINTDEITKKITVTKSLEEWESFIYDTFIEFKRILKPDGMIAFEVGEIKKGKIKLEDNVISIAQKVGFNIEAVMINKQKFTKTANIWGVTNNLKGVNTNRIVILRK